MTYWYFTCTGAAKINVIDISQVDNPRIVFHQYMGDFDPTDVEFCGDHVFVSLDNNQDREKGRLVVFKKYDTKANTLESVLNITGKIISVRNFFYGSHFLYLIAIFRISF